MCIYGVYVYTFMYVCVYCMPLDGAILLPIFHSDFKQNSVGGELSSLPLQTPERRNQN